ncbi:hypothetical protein [Ekhidna sp.]|uniref:hypothetical protein n=1 Tax=Ekhidna sp. TaxID=2608089 RepID=UPI003C7AE07A
MKLISALLLLSSYLMIQESPWKSIESIPKKYQIDGSYSGLEMLDTLEMKPAVTDNRFVIKKSKDFTYIAIRSNTSTILNAYIVNENEIKVLHASAALGQVDFKKEGDAFIPTQSSFDWIYRDPTAWGDELHPDGEQTLEGFYERFGWMASTWYMGSYRDFEMIIDNSHFEDNSRLLVSYTSMENNERSIRMKEGNNFASLTGNYETDVKLHNGNIPESINLR